MSTKTIVTITGIRPDFIRMCFIFKKLDKNFKHILIHTGQHYDEMLSDIFFKDLDIRKPDYILNTGKESKNHYEQLSYLSKAVPELFIKENIKPDLILFLGDSNTSAVSLPLKKEGYTIGHIEAGMRSYDNRMLEEINRKVCDMCSSVLFVYHDTYKEFLAKENIHNNIFVVGNTIVEPTLQFLPEIQKNMKKNNLILLDIHRPENFNYPDRLRSIIAFANECTTKYNLPVKLLYFKRLAENLEKFGISLGSVEMIPLMGYKEYLNTIYHCRFIISDSGTGQEEPALLDTPVIVPRDFSERPMSYLSNCSVKFTAGSPNSQVIWSWLDDIESGRTIMDKTWLGNGATSQEVIDGLKQFFKI